MIHMHRQCTSKRPARRLAFAISGILLASTAGAAGGPAYTFINIADSSGPLSTFIHNAAVNDSGIVAFAAGPDAGGKGIYRGNGGPLTTIALTGSGQPYSNLEVPAINAAGDIAFRGVTSNGDQIFKYQSGTTIPITTGWPYTNVSVRPSINDAGTVAFEASYFATYQGIYSGSGGDVAMHFENSQGVFSSFGEPLINSSGEIGFVAFKPSTGLGVFRGSSGSYVTIADTAGDFSAFGSVVDMNGSGLVLFEALRDAGGAGIYAGDGNQTATIASTDDGYSLSIGNVGRAINDSGQVAFVSSLGGQFGIFTGDDPVADKVLKTGETLFGSTVVALECNRDAINNHGDIAFKYALSNGISGIALAKVVTKVQPGDITGDGTVNVNDLLMVINAWGNCPQPCPPSCAADIAPAGGNCIVNVDDLLMVINNWS